MQHVSEEADDDLTFMALSVGDWATLIEGVHGAKTNLHLKNLQDHALVDTAAGQALIGQPDLEVLTEALAKKGYRVHAEFEPPVGVTASGIGGKAKPVGRAWVPAPWPDAASSIS